MRLLHAELEPLRSPAVAVQTRGTMPGDYCSQCSKYGYVLYSKTVSQGIGRMEYLSEIVVGRLRMDCEGSYAEGISEGLNALQSLQSNG